MMQIIFTDLDGSLLDYDGYSFEKATEALDILRKNGIPLVFCTSKTRAEIEFWRKKLDNKDPFISENGGAIFIPKGYFDFEFEHDFVDEDYFIIELGIKYEKLIEIVKKIKDVKGFHQMGVDEIADETGLPLDQAGLAKKRDYCEPIKIMGDIGSVLSEIKKNGLNYTKGGLYYHIMGDGSKGKAVKILIELFRKKYGEITTVGIGDSENDFDMLDNVDKAFLVQKRDGSYASDKYGKAKGIGAEGWSEVVGQVLSNNL